jgi:CHAT domain-containing protein
LGVFLGFNPRLARAEASPSAAVWPGQLERADGVAVPDFVFCQTLPLDQLRQLNTALRVNGYWPRRLRPYRQGNVVRVAGIWGKGGPESQFESNLTSAQVRLRDAELRRGGFVPADVAGYSDPAGDRYLVLWTKESPRPVRRLYLGMTIEEYDETYQSLGDAGFRPLTLTQYCAADSQTRLSGVWEGGDDEPVRWQIAWGEANYFRPRVHAFTSYYCQVDSCLCTSGPRHAAYFSGIWYPVDPLKSGMPTSVQVEGTISEQRRRALEMAKQGYRPVALSVTAQGDLQELAALSIWHRPLPEETRAAIKSAGQATALGKSGKKVEAAALLTQALNALIRTEGEATRRVADWRWNLALLRQDLKQEERAIDLLLHALGTYRLMGSLGLDDQLAVLLRLADLYDARADRVRAVARREEACALAASLYGLKSKNYLEVLRSVAINYQQHGELKSARAAYLKALPLSEEILGANHKDTIALVNMLGIIAFNGEDWQQAESYFGRIVAQRRHTDAVADAEYLGFVRALAIARYHQKHYAEAAPAFEEVRAGLAKASGRNDSSYQVLLGWLVACYKAISDPHRGLPACEELRALLTRHPGKEHAEYARCLADLAGFQEALGNQAAAEASLRECLDIQVKTLGEAHDRTLLTLTSLARLARASQRFDDAERWAMRFRDAVERGNKPRPYVLLTRQLLGNVYREKGEYARAEPLLREALALVKSLEGEESTGYALRLADLGNLERLQERPAVAEADLRRAADILRLRLGETNDDYLERLRDLLRIYIRFGPFDKGEALAQQIYEIHTRVHGARHPATVASLDELGNALVINRKINASIDVYRRVLNLRQALYPAGHPERIAPLRRLAGILEIAAQLSDALPLRQQVLTEAAAVKQKQPLAYADYLAELGKLYLTLGRANDAEALFIQARDLLARTVGEHHLAYARALRNLAECYDSRGQRAEAETCLLRSHEIVQPQAAAAANDYRESLTALAAHYEKLGDQAKAQAYVKQAPAAGPVELARQWVEAQRQRHSQAMELCQRGEYRLAEPLLARACLEDKQVLGEESLSYAAGLGTLAFCYREMGELGEAEALLRKSEQLGRKVFGPESLLYASCQIHRADLHARLGEYRQAGELYQQAAAILKHTEDGGITLAACRGKLGLLSLGLGQAEKAAGLIEQALQVKLKQYKDTLPGLSEAEALAFLSDPFLGQSRDALLDALRARPGEVSRAYAAVWETRGLLFRFLTNQITPAAGDGRAGPLFEKLRRARRELAQATFTPAPPGQAETRKRRLAELSAAKEDLEKALARVSKPFGRTAALQNASPAETLRRLPDGVALVDFVQVTRRIYAPAAPGLHDEVGHYEAFVSRSSPGPTGYTVHWVPLGPTEQIDEAIRTWTADLFAEVQRPGGRPKRPQLPEQLLFKQLWEPLGAYLSGCRTIVIVPDGLLSQVPWPALPGTAPGKFLCDEHVVATLSYPQQLADLLGGEDRLPNERLVLVGGIDYDGDTPRPAVAPTRPTWPPLPGSLLEVQALARLRRPFGEVTLLSGATADKEKTLSALLHCRYAHLATHGFFADEQTGTRPPDLSGAELVFRSGVLVDRPRGTVAARNPLLLSGLVLAGANTAAEGKIDFGTGILTAEEVAALDLHALELVVLSACETALGRHEARQGVFGLQTAFQLAGARTTIGSLWKVEDRAARTLMVEFYRNLWERKLTRLEALSQAQRTLRLRYDPRAGVLRGVGGTLPVQPSGPIPPFFWAAFTLHGDWR